MAAYTTAKSLGVGEEDEEEWQKRFARRKEAAKVGEWEAIPTLSPAPAPVAATPAPEAVPPMQTERDAARAFALHERRIDDETEDEVLPEVVTKRPRTEALEPLSVKQEAGKLDPDAVHATQELAAPCSHAPGAETSSVDSAPRVSSQEPGPDATPVKNEAASDDVPCAPSSDAGLFRKRKARGGAAKKVGGSAFA